WGSRRFRGYHPISYALDSLGVVANDDRVGHDLRLWKHDADLHDALSPSTRLVELALEPPLSSRDVACSAIPAARSARWMASCWSANPRLRTRSSSSMVSWRSVPAWRARSNPSRNPSKACSTVASVGGSRCPRTATADCIK